MLLDLKHSRALHRQHQARKTPLLIFTASDVVGMADALRREFFPTVSISPEVIFTNGSFLGCISRTAPAPESLICLHEILNSPDVPEQVFRHILTHELIHLVVAPREVDGKVTTHPPEFWQLENDLCPERSWIWEWLWDNFHSCLLIDKKNECIKVKRDWRKRTHLQCRSLDEIISAAPRNQHPEGIGI
jgi:hypothetical protein